MRFCVLGQVEIAAGSRRVSVGRGSQRLVLAVLLAARGGIVSAERLIDALWGTTPPASARKSLHSHVSRLRRGLEASEPGAADALVTEADGYAMDLQGRDLDAARFERLLARARNDLDTEADEALRRLDEALELWRGPAFGDLADQDLVRPEAVRLEELRAAASADRVDARLALGDHHRVIGELEAAVASHPLAERPHGQLMLALYRSGRQADALASYQRLRTQLRDEIGVDPSPELQRLLERILRQDDDLAVPSRVAPAGGERAARARRDPSSDVPPEVPGDLLGRGEDVTAVTRLITAAPLVTLTGPGGVGKSRLAEAVATMVGEQFDDGVAWCELAAVRVPASVPSALIETLGIQHQGDRAPEEALLAALGTRRLLLVLDNCEHLLGAVARLVDHVRGRCPHLAMLTTSRERLHLSGERVWEVTPLPVPRAGADRTEVAATASGALLCARVRAVEPTFALTDANAATIAQLCRRLDGIPLAIELAAARLRALAPADLVARLDQRFDVLTGGHHAEADRHRTLRAVVDWSYRLLTDAEACLFDRLSVFAGPFPLAAAEHVGAGTPLEPREVAGVLAELVDKSLVAVDRAGDRVRYRLLDTLRAYGSERLEEAGDADRTRHAHAAHHVRFAEDLAPRLRGAEERTAIARLDAALDDLRVAHAWLVEAREVDGALRLPAALHDDLIFRPRAEMFTWAERALELPRATEHPAYAAAAATAARGAMNRGDLDRARRLAATALAAADPHDLAALWALYVLTTTALYEGDLDDALALADRRIEVAGELGEAYHRALAGVSRALALRYRGEDTEAVRAAAEARRDAEASGSPTAEAWVSYSHGEVLLDTDPSAAATLLEQAIDAARRVDRRFIEGVALVSLASLYGRSDRTDLALPLFRETVAHWRRLSAYPQQLTTLRNLVELLVRLGADEPAALLHGAVTAGPTMSFGAEAERLAAARDELVRRLGDDVVADAAERGRRLTPAGLVDTALAVLDVLLDDQVTAGPPGP